MVFLRALLSHQIHSTLKHHNQTFKGFAFFQFFSKPIFYSSQIDSIQNDSTPIVKNDRKTKKPLEVIFKEAVGLIDKIDTDSEGENDSDVKKTLRKLGKEVKELKSDSKETRGLHALFANKNGGVGKDLESSRREPVVMKKLSEEMLFFVSHLYNEGYFSDANFLHKKGFEVSCFDDVYGREYIKFAAEKFGKDNQEIAKWLSGSDVKLVAQFGCPSLLKKSIFAAKRLRIFFKIQEDTVCNKCILKQSCKFAGQSIWKGDTMNLHLVDVMKVITLYAIEATPPLLVVPDDLKAAVNRVLKEALNLSQTIS